MLAWLNSPLKIGNIKIDNRLIQGPLAGFSCAPFRALFSKFAVPGYCVSEMISARDIVYKHSPQSRYLYRAAEEHRLCYQISGTDPEIMAEAASKLAFLKADLIDINCGCPKKKIRKKGAGSALLEDPDRLVAIIRKVRSRIACPLTVKIRLQKNDQDLRLAEAIADAGANALIVHGRRWQDDYNTACDWQQIARIKKNIAIPLIANGDISDPDSIRQVLRQTGCDAFMIARAGCGKPWLYASLLQDKAMLPAKDALIPLFMEHIKALAVLEGEHQALLQGKSLFRYYFGKSEDPGLLKTFYALTAISDIEGLLANFYKVN